MFVDLSGRSRRQFYEDDFFCNHYFNQDVYQKLLGIRVNDTVELTDNSDAAYDRVIQMARIDVSHNLTAQLLEGSLAESDFQKIGWQMAKMIAEFPHPPKTKKNYYEIMRSFVQDIEGWTYLADPLIPKGEAQEVIRALYAFLETQKDFFGLYREKDFVA